MNRKVVLVVLVAVTIGGGLWLRSYFAPEKVIGRLFFDAVVAFESEEFLATMAVIDREYHDQYGQSYESLAGNIRLLHDTYEGLELSLEPPTIQVRDDQARMEFRFILWGSV